MRPTKTCTCMRIPMHAARRQQNEQRPADYCEHKRVVVTHMNAPLVDTAVHVGWMPSNVNVHKTKASLRCCTVPAWQHVYDRIARLRAVAGKTIRRRPQPARTCTSSRPGGSNLLYARACMHPSWCAKRHVVAVVSILRLCRASKGKGKGAADERAQTLPYID